MATVAVFMSRYGVVQSVGWDYSKLQDFKHVHSTIRTIVLQVEPGVKIPSVDSLVFQDESYKFLITVPGRGPVCFRCGVTGHTRQNCSALMCRHCKSMSHTSEECVVSKSYASMVNTEQDQAGTQGEGDLPEEEMETKSTEEYNVDLNKDSSDKSETAHSTSGGNQVGASGVDENEKTRVEADPFDSSIDDDFLGNGSDLIIDKSSSSGEESGDTVVDVGKKVKLKIIDKKSRRKKFKVLK